MNFVEFTLARIMPRILRQLFFPVLCIFRGWICAFVDNEHQ